MKMNDNIPRKLGADLKRIREEKNMSLEDIFNKTKINVAFLKEIENDRFDFLHTPYILAFIKAYAKALGLDPEPIAERFNEQIRSELSVSIREKIYMQAPGIPDQPAQSLHTIREKQAFPASRMKQPGKNRIIFYVSIAAFVIVVVLLQHYLKPSEERLIVNPQESQAMQQPLLMPEDTIKSRPAEPEILKLRVVVNDTVWFRIQADNKEPREYIFLPGNTRTWDAAERFDIRTGKSTGFELYFNENLLTGLGTEKTLIGRLVLTKDGVQTKRLLLRE